MKDSKEWFINRLTSGDLSQEDTQQIAWLISWLDREKEERKNSQYEVSLNTAMLADLCELIFDKNGKGAPSFMSYAHAGWACGPCSKPEKDSYVKTMLNYWNKNQLKQETIEKIQEWEMFLNREKDVRLRLQEIMQSE